MALPALPNPFFFPLDEKLVIGTEGYSPQVLKKAVRQASKATSFADASDDLRELANIMISPTHLERLSERIGSEWAKVRDAEIIAFQERKVSIIVGTVASDALSSVASTDSRERTTTIAAHGFENSNNSSPDSSPSTSHFIRKCKTTFTSFFAHGPISLPPGPMRKW